MGLKIAICDDEPDQRSYLLETVSAWAKKNRHPAELRAYADAKAFFFDYGTEKDFDILLLDVEMPGMSGVELAKEVRRDNTAIQIIFITGYYEYFSDGFDVSALHYLIKPVDAGKLCPVLDRAAGNLMYRERAVLISDADGSVKVPLADIQYVESENVHIIIYTVHKKYRMRMALRKFEEQLDETFFKVHRSFLVNLRYVKKITRTDVTIVDGSVIPLSRGMYDAVHAALIRYL